MGHPKVQNRLSEQQSKVLFIRPFFGKPGTYLCLPG